MIRKRTITLSDAEWDALDRLASSKGISRHAMFRQMAQKALARKLPPVVKPVRRRG